MAEMTLTATPALGGLDITGAACRLQEVDALTLTSIAMPIRGKTKLSKALKEAFGLARPTPTVSVTANGRRLLALGPDLFLLIGTGNGWQAERDVNAALGGAGYTTDQSDVWVGLRLSGPGWRGVMERLCPLDLHDSAFPVDAAVRTVMEHLGVLMIRTGEDEVLLLSASSSARSFAHALETTLGYVE